MNASYDNLPLDLKHPGGFVEDVMHYLDDTAVCPQPIFSLGTALSLAGLLYGRHVQSEDGLATNLYVECVGYTSCGKDHGLKSIARILDAAHATHLRMGQVTSDSAIEWALKRQPRQIALIDEAGHFFSGVSDPSAKGSPARSIKPALLELWSSANGRWIGKQRVPKDGHTAPEPVVVDRPHLCLYGTSQPQILFEGITKCDLRDGWIARNLWFLSTTRPLPESRPVAPVPNAILSEVFCYKSEPAEPGAGGGVVTVPADAAAQTVFAHFAQDVHAKMLAADKSGDETNYLYGKAGENARRIALVLAVSRAGGVPFKARIEERDAVYATTLVTFLVETVLLCINETLAENVDEKNKKRLLKVIASAGRNGVTRNELTRRSQFLRRAMREEYLVDLIEAGQIAVVTFADGHTHGEKIMLAAFARQE